jgi:hypothetical protein
LISVDEFDCLDLLLWLRSGAAVRQRLGFSQSKISRAVRRVSDLYGVFPVRRDGGWIVVGDTTLVDLQRRVHQEYRWTSGRPLRLEGHFHSAALFSDSSPEGWIKGNFDFLEVHAPLQCLRNGVIDAWIGLFPDVPEQGDQDFCCVHLTQMPLHLVVAKNHPLLALEHQVTLEDVKHYPSLALPDNAFPRLQVQMQSLGLWQLPIPLKRYKSDKCEGRVMGSDMVGYVTSSTPGNYNPPQVILPIRLPVEVGDVLVVRREYEMHPRFAELVQYLKGRSVELSQRFSDVHLCF